MLKRIFTYIVIALLLLCITIPVSAKDSVERKPPVTTYTYTKTKYLNGSEIKVEITCDVFEDTVSSIMSYNDGSARIVSVSGGGTARILAEEHAGHSSSDSDDIMSVIITVELNKNNVRSRTDIVFAFKRNTML